MHLANMIADAQLRHIILDAHERRQVRVHVLDPLAKHDCTPEAAPVTGVEVEAYQYAPSSIYGQFERLTNIKTSRFPILGVRLLGTGRWRSVCCTLVPTTTRTYVGAALPPLTKSDRRC